MSNWRTKIIDTFTSQRVGVKAFQKSISFVFGERFIRLLLGFFIHALVVRYLGPKIYGVYGIAFSLFVLSRCLVNYGAEDLVLKDLIDKEFDRGTVLGSVLAYKFFFAVVSYFLLILFSYLFYPEEPMIIMLVAILGFFNFFNVFIAFETQLQSKSQFKEISLARLYGYLISTVLKLLFVFLKLDVLFFAAIFVIDIVIVRFMMFRYIKTDNLQWKFSSQYAIQFFYKSWPLLLTTILLILSERLGLFFLSTHRSIAEVGNYNVLLNLTQFCVFIPIGVLSVILPKIIETRKKAPEKYEYRVSAIYFVMITIGLGFTCFFFLFSKLIVPVIYGDKFLMLADYLPYGFLIATMTYINLAKAKHIILEGLNREWLIYNMGSLCSIVLLLSMTVEEHGFYGIVFSYIVGCLVFDILYSLASPSYRKVTISILKSPMFPVKFLKKRL